MVAEATLEAPSKRGGKCIPAPRLVRVGQIPLLTRLKIRTLYLSQDLGPSAIAKLVDLSPVQVSNIISREGFSKLRRAKIAKIEKRVDSYGDAILDEASTQVASECAEITLGAMDRARQCVEKGGKFAARDFQAWTGGMRNMMQVQRLARGSDEDANAGGSGGGNTFFIVRCGDYAAKGERNVTPAQSAEITVAKAT